MQSAERRIAPCQPQRTSAPRSAWNCIKKSQMPERNRTLAFQIDEELFQRIKAHLERESARPGRKVTQREFVLNAIIGVLNMSEPMDADGPGQEATEKFQAEYG